METETVRPCLVQKLRQKGGGLVLPSGYATVLIFSKIVANGSKKTVKINELN